MKLKHFLPWFSVLILLSALLVPGAHGAAHAAGLAVNTLVDENDHSCIDADCSLRDAIEVAPAGETITFDVTGTLTLALDQLTLAQDLTLSGPGANNLLISGDDKFRVFKISPGVTVSISGITITKGQIAGLFEPSDGGAGIRNEGSLTVNESSLVDNRANGGAGIFNSGTAVVTHSTFINNDAFLTEGDEPQVFESYGGGIRNEGTLTVEDSSFEHNLASAGSGIFNAGTADVRRSTFSENGAIQRWVSGGGISNTNMLTVSDSTFQRNEAISAGGMFNSGTAVVSQSLFDSNFTFNTLTGGTGGGILNFGNLSVANSTFVDNAAVGGVGPEQGTGHTIANYHELLVSNSTIAYTTGGASAENSIYNEGALASISNTIFEHAGCVGTLSDGGGNLRWPLSEPTCVGNYGNPKLEPLADNGGVTRTMALGVNSAALEHGVPANCPAVDQRGESRPNPGASPCDTGAFESDLRPTLASWEDYDPDVQYGGWRGEEYTDAHGTDRISRTRGDKIVYRFKGRQVGWYTRRGPNMGIARVKIDGVDKGLVDLYNPSEEWPFFKGFYYLGRGAHTLVIKVTGVKNPGAVDSNVVIDAFNFRTFRVTQDPSLDIKYSKWVGVEHVSASEGSFRMSKARKAVARLSFTGTRIDWLTARGPAYGKARVLIDGVVMGKYDLYAPAEEWQVPITFEGLSDTDHTIEIKVLGKKNVASSGKAVVVDAFNQPVELP